MKAILKNITLFTIYSLILVCLVWLEWPDEHVHIIFCDVGQGDAILITDGFTQVLVDAGAGSRVNYCLEKHIPFWDRNLEFIVESHADNDHIGGFRAVFSDFFVENIVLNEFGKETSSFKQFRDFVLREKNEGMNLIDPNLNSQIVVSDRIVLQNLSTRGEASNFSHIFSDFPETQLWDKVESQQLEVEGENWDINSLSIVNLVVVGKIKILLTGDLDIRGEQALMSKGLIEDIDILKVGHHGSKTSTGDQFLNMTSPEMSVISVGHNNSYGHPNEQVLAKLRGIGSQILRTDQLGEVEFITDGESYWLEVP